MNLPLQPPISPMEALSVEEIHRGEQWQYEPKWDGFRCLAFRAGGEVQLQSKSTRLMNNPAARSRTPRRTTQPAWASLGAQSA